MGKAFHAVIVCGIVAAVSPVAAGALTNFLDGSSLPHLAPNVGWAQDPGAADPGAIVPLGGGNDGIKHTDSGAGYDEWYLTINDKAGTFAAHFEVDSFTANKPVNIMLLTTATNGGDKGPAVGLGIRNNAYALFRFFPGHDLEILVPSIEPVLPGEFHKAAIYVDSVTDTVRFSWDDVELYNAATVSLWGPSTEGYAEFGACTAWAPDESGASMITFDWVGYGAGYVPEPATLSLLAIGGAWIARRRGIF